MDENPAACHGVQKIADVAVATSDQHLLLQQAKKGSELFSRRF